MVCVVGRVGLAGCTQGRAVTTAGVVTEERGSAFVVGWKAMGNYEE